MCCFYTKTREISPKVDTFKENLSKKSKSEKIHVSRGTFFTTCVSCETKPENS